MAAAITLAVVAHDVKFKARGPQVVCLPGIRNFNFAPPTTAPTSQPLPEIERITLSNIEDLGGVTLADGSPARQLCQYTIEQTRVTDPATHTWVQTTVPCRQVILVSMDSY